MRNLYGIGLFIVLVLSINSQVLQAEQDVDVIYLKNGKIISGKIVERIPDKTVVIETKDGIEFVDFVDIKRIQKEFIPRIDGFSPLSGESGTTLSLTGSFPATQPKGAIVYVGEVSAEVVQWSKEKVDILVPDLMPGDYAVTVQNSSQKDIARMAFTVNAKNTAKPERVRTQKKTTPQEIPEEGYTTGGFWMLLGYAMPLGDFGKSDQPTSGFAKNGFSIGYEGRISLSQNFYLPLNFQVSYLGFNIDELKKQTSITASSDGKSYGMIWFTGGLGFAIHMSSSAYLFASADYGITMVHRPDVQFGNPVFVKRNSVNTFTGGYGFSGGITFAEDVTFGYRMFSCKPKHKIEVSFTNSSITQEVEIEQPTDVGLIYLSIGW